MNSEECHEMAIGAFDRILDAETMVARSGASATRIRLLARLAALDGQIGQEERTKLFDHIMEQFGKFKKKKHQPQIDS